MLFKRLIKEDVKKSVKKVPYSEKKPPPNCSQAVSRSAPDANAWRIVGIKPWALSYQYFRKFPNEKWPDFNFFYHQNALIQVIFVGGSKCYPPKKIVSLEEKSNNSSNFLTIFLKNALVKRFWALFSHLRAVLKAVFKGN